MRAWRLATPLLALFAAACLLDSSGLLLSDADDDGTSTTTGGFGGQPATTSATGGTTSTSTASTGGQGGATTSGGGDGGDGGSGGAVVGWSHRMNVTVQALTAPVPAGYSVFVDFPHAQLVGAAQALASGDDVYVVRDDGSTLQVIDRVVDPSSAWNQGATRIWFETSAAISASTSDAGYWIYYGNPEASAPPADPANVFLRYDDFSVAPPGWVHGPIGGATGNTFTSAGNLHIEGTTGDIFGQNDSFYFARFPVTGVDVAVRAKVVASGGSLPGYAVLGGVMIRQSVDDSSRFVLATPAGGYYLTYQNAPKYPANRANTYRLSLNGEAAEDTANDPSGLLPVVVEAARSGVVGRSSYSSDGLNFSPIGTPHNFATWSNSDYLAGVAFANDGTGVGFADVDWFLMRSYVDPEPLTLPGAIETGTFTLP